MNFQQYEEELGQTLSRKTLHPAWERASGEIKVDSFQILLEVQKAFYSAWFEGVIG